MLAAWQATIVDEAGNTQAAASVEVLVEQTGATAALFSDRDGLIPILNPVTADSDGFVRFYAAGGAYRVNATRGSFTRTWRHVALGLLSERDVVTETIVRYEQTAGELAASVTPVNYYYRPGHILRYGVNANPGNTDLADALQAAIDSRTSDDPVVTLTGNIGIGRTILIPETSPQNLTITGTGRTSTILFPLAADISVSTRDSVPAEDVNTMFFNQKDNGHLHLRSFRILDSAAYTGKFLVAIEGGGADASGEALYSAVIDDCWFSLSSNNTGIFHGGFSNLIATSLVFEGTKDACFILEGGGNGDLQFRGCVMNACYDSFIRQQDQLVNFLLVDGLQVYQHLRGRIFDLTNAHGLISNVQVEWDAANVGDCWLARVSGSNVNISKCREVTYLGTPRGDGGIDISGANTVKLSDLKICADVGLRVQGTGAVDVDVNDCEFDGCQYAFQQLSGSLSGRIGFNNTKLNNSDEYGMLHQAGTPSFSIYFQGGEVINAGLGGITTSRNINIDTSGEVRFVGTRIGQDNANADAACFIRADGAGLFRLTDCPIVGSAPTSIVDASSTQSVQIVWEPTADLTGTKTFQVASGTSSAVVPDAEVQAGCFIDIHPTNAAAATVMGSSKSLYVSAINAGTSFTVTTADGTNVAANANFRYRIHP